MRSALVGVLALSTLIAGCGRIGSSIDKNWSGHGAQAASSSAAVVAGSAASAPNTVQSAYNFVASRLYSEPPACGPYLLTLQLVFGNDHDVTALISNQAWPCVLHESISAYDIACETPRPGAGQLASVDAALWVVLYETPSAARIAGEATLTIRSAAGSCEHGYALEGTRSLSAP